MKTIYLAGGCFWGTQRFFDQFDGVLETEVGYANGPEGAAGQAADSAMADRTAHAAAPTYEDVCNNSGHAETVRVVFDESRISLAQLLRYYFMVIDPLSVNRQGHDVGIQYRTGIYYTDPDMPGTIREVCDEVERSVGAPLAVEVEPLINFYPAEEYHQKYLVKNPGGYCHIPAALFTLGKK